MAFPTATVTQGSGLTINTLPNAGQATMANSLGVAIASDQSPVPVTALSAIPVTALNSGSITNPSSVLTRPALAITSAVTATSASPCVFTWTGNPLLSGQTVILGGTAVPTGFSANTPYYVEGVSGNTFQLAPSFFGTAIGSSSTGTAVTATLCYTPNSIVWPTGAIIPSFSIATSAGGAILPRIRLVTNIAGVQQANGRYVGSGWDGATVSINLWSAAPTGYLWQGDGGPYAPSAGTGTWLANFIVTLTQFGDVAAGSGVLTGANEVALKLASGTSVFWDAQILTMPGTFLLPIVSQTLTLTAELLN
jgi:hypothetical protein